MTTERERIEQAVAALDTQRAVLGDAVADAAIAALREQLAAREAQSPSEERRLVTVLFADLAGFTALAERLDPEDLHDTMQAFFARMTGVVERHGGVTEKYIGDAVMAVFGLQVAREDDAANAVRAALAMQHALAELNLELAQASAIRLVMRVGVNTGMAVAGRLGGTAAGELTVVGDTVNVAARLQAAAPESGVLIGEATYAQVRGLFTVQAQLPLAVKGKREPLQTYVVLSERPRAFDLQVRGLAGIDTRTVGRGDELAQLCAAYEESLAGPALSCVTVTGEAGVGKSRLLLEFERWLDQRPEQIWYLKARAWPQGERRPYALLRDLLTFRFVIGDNDALVVARNKLVAGLSEVLGQKLGAEAAAFVGQLAGFDFRDTPWIAPLLADTQQIHGRAAVLLREYLVRLCAAGPAALLLEDVQWADDASLALLAGLLAGPEPPAPLVVIGLARPEFWKRESAWGRAAGGRRLDLKPLGAPAAAELVRELLQRVDAPPEWLVELLVERGGGNPYFTEELVRWLIEQGVIEAGPETWCANAAHAVGLSVPGTVQGVLQARLAPLPPEARAALQCAGVLGRTFWGGAVDYVGERAVPAEEWLVLQGQDLIARQPATQLAGEQEYRFRHALLRDVVYEQTLRKQRRVYHRRAAEWLARAAGERAGEWAATIAGHFADAGEALLAAEWYGRAAQQARDSYAPDPAIEYYTRALEALPDAPEHAARRVTLYEGAAETLWWQARHTEALEAYRAMCLAAETAGDRVAQVRAWNGLARVSDHHGDHAATLEATARAAEAARAVMEPGQRAAAQVQLATALYGRGWALHRLGDVTNSRALAEEALAVSTALDARHEMAHSYNLLGVVLGGLGQWERAERYLQQAADTFEALGDRRWAAVVRSNLAEAALQRGEYAAAMTLSQETLAGVRAIGNREAEILALNNLGGARVALGAAAEAEADLRRVIALAGATNWSGLAETYSFLAEALLAQGRAPEAREAAEKALALAEETGHQELVAQAWYVLGLVAASPLTPNPLSPLLPPGRDDRQVRSLFPAAGEGRGGQGEWGAACFARSAEIYAAVGVEVERARVLRAWARYERARGDLSRAGALLAEAREIFARLGITAEVARTDAEQS